MTGRVLRQAGRPAVVAAAGVAAVAIGAGAVRSPTLVVVAVVAAGIAWITFSNLLLGLAGFVVLTFFESIPGVSGATPTKPAGFLLIVSWLGAVIRNRELPLLPRTRPALAYLLVGFVGWSLVSAAWAPDPGAARSTAFRLVQVLLLLFVAYSAIRTARDLAVVVWSFITGSFLVAATSLASGNQIAGRLTAGALDPNFLAAVLVAAAILAAFTLATTRRGWVRLALLAFLATYIVGIVETQSRGGLVAACAAIVAACAVGGPLRPRAVAIACASAALAIGYYAVLAPATLRERVTQISAQSSASRTDTWRIALRIAGGHPVGGVGIGNFQAVESSYIASSLNLPSARLVLGNRLVVHNTYLQVLSELGIVGLLLFVAILGVTLAIGLDALRRVHPASPTAHTFRGVVCAVVGLLVAYVFLSGQYEKPLWLLLGVAASLGTVARSEAGPATTPRGRESS